jgi:hypothetical protein
VFSSFVTPSSLAPVVLATGHVFFLPLPYLLLSSSARPCATLFPHLRSALTGESSCCTPRSVPRPPIVKPLTPYGDVPVASRLASQPTSVAELPCNPHPPF